MANNNNRPTTRTAETSDTAPTSSQTVLETNAGPSIPIPALRLRAERPEPRRRIQWADDVVDNEGMGKKSSKVCCIYHKPHEAGDSESSDESSSSSSDDGSDSEPDLSRARRAGDGGKGKRRGGDGGGGEEGKDKGKGKQRKASPNAYERQPKYKSKQDG